MVKIEAELDDVEAAILVDALENLISDVSGDARAVKGVEDLRAKLLGPPTS